MIRRSHVLGGAVAAALVCLALPVQAQQLTLDLGSGGQLTGRIIQFLALLTVLSLAPSILIMVTSFTRIVVVLSLLRSALGVQQTPPNTVLISLALFLTLFVMTPTLQQVYQNAVVPLVNEDIDEFQAFDRGVEPVRGFMLKHVRENDLAMFVRLSGETPPADLQAMPLHILVPAFIISELRRAFEIGFLLFIPFLVIDMVVASVLMAMGMMMLPPVMISLPFKLIFFVLVDGWNLVAGSLVQSFGT
ncbi:MAG TPA: flagellar type III secretion system pore protein FliP [Alphaproteobacteria bacterium]|nr:flagellar type III secretion system pore protein FliP [Alphaproteobacteria bacterium]